MSHHKNINFKLHLMIQHSLPYLIVYKNYSATIIMFEILMVFDFNYLAFAHLAVAQ